VSFRSFAPARLLAASSTAADYEPVPFFSPGILWPAKLSEDCFIFFWPILYK
jgi:hypothetical protein